MTTLQKTSCYISVCSTLLLFNACSPSKVPVSEGGFYCNGIYFGQNLSETYKQGIRNGCQTAKGEYQKLHKKFNTDDNYRKGWFLGRKKCKHLLKIDEKGDLIL